MPSSNKWLFIIWLLQVYDEIVPILYLELIQDPAYSLVFLNSILIGQIST